MTTPILVTGGTGTLGRAVVPRLQATGAPVRVLSRRDRAPADGVECVRGDLTTGEGVDAALAGVEIVLHCAGSAKGDGQKASTLVAAAQRAGVEHIVYVSVVGADRLPVVSRVDRAMFGYFAAKREAEEVIAGSGVGWTTLRATQFHDLALTVLQAAARLPVLPVPSGLRFQPVDVRDVADRLVELTVDKPAGLVPDIAGPRVYAVADLARGYLRAAGKHRLILPVHVPGRAARAVRAGANLAPEAVLGTRTWEDFLAGRVGRR